VPIYNGFYRQGAVGGSVGQPFPDALRIFGPFLPVQIEAPSALVSQVQQEGKPPPAPVAGFALIDTGATATAVDETAIGQLGVQPIDVATVGTAGGAQPRLVYPGRLSFPGTPLGTFEFGRLLGVDLAGQSVPLPQGQIIVLLGRDILQRCILIYNGSVGMFSLSF